VLFTFCTCCTLKCLVCIFVVVLCVLLSSYVYLLYCVCIAVSTIDAGLTYFLTYSMVQSPSWAAYWLAASQEIPRISRNPKVHYCTHKRTPPVPILGQPNPVHMPTSHLQMPDWWLEVSIRKVLRLATSTQVFLGFSVSISKHSDGSQHSKLPLHAYHVALRS